ncbi:MAG TPA: SCP2 sterol-binding domain-containing protein [Mycobacteriales bacterium]|nr:SCP2 sterol-binding domain-containing protein [Mycobacteriales bacterium]
MATPARCQRAVDYLVLRLSDVPLDTRRRHAPDRRLTIEVTDLGIAYVGRMAQGELVDVACVPLPVEGEPAQVRLAVSSDDLVALADGVLSLSSAWATGKLRVDASVLDMVRLRALL